LFYFGKNIYFQQHLGFRELIFLPFYGEWMEVPLKKSKIIMGLGVVEWCIFKKDISDQLLF